MREEKIITKLEIEDYCQGCPYIDPMVIKKMAVYADDRKFAKEPDIVITCKQSAICKRVEQMKTPKRRIGGRRGVSQKDNEQKGNGGTGVPDVLTRSNCAGEGSTDCVPAEPQE